MAKRYIAAFFFLAITVLSCTDPGSASQLPVYSLKYDGNGNTQGSVPAGASAESGNWIALSENTGFLMRISDENESHAFVSWNAEPDGSGDSFSPGSYMTLTENTTLFAQYGVFLLESRRTGGGICFL